MLAKIRTFVLLALLVGSVAGCASPGLSLPTHGGVDAGVGMTGVFSGILQRDGSCLMMGALSGEVAEGVGSVLPVWSDGYRVVFSDAGLGLAHPDGFVVARLGERVEVRGHLSAGAGVGDAGIWWSGGEVAECGGMFLLVEEAVLLVPGDRGPGFGGVLFPRSLDEVESNVSLTALLVGVLSVRDGCLRVVRESSYEGPVVVWPADARLAAVDGVLEVLGGDGRLLARVGDEVSVGGGVPFGRQFDGGSGCDGSGWHASVVDRVR